MQKYYLHDKKKHYEESEEQNNKQQTFVCLHSYFNKSIIK